MKVYISEILNKYKRFSQSLDMRTIFSKNSWLAFNENKEKEIYIFQDNGSLLFSTNGHVKRGKWEYIKTNNSVILELENQIFMFHPFIGGNNSFLILQLDGTEQFLIFYEDNQQERTFKSLQEIENKIKNISTHDNYIEPENTYFQEHIYIDNEEYLKRKAEARRRAEKKKAEAYQREIEQIEYRKAKEIYRQKFLKENTKYTKHIGCLDTILLIIVTCLFLYYI